MCYITAVLGNYAYFLDMLRQLSFLAVGQMFHVEHFTLSGLRPGREMAETGTLGAQPQ